MTTELAKSTITKARAMRLCSEIRDGMGSIAEKLSELHENCGWTVLGYLTWKECCEKEFRHSTWWAKNQLRIANVRKALPPPPPKQGTECLAIQTDSTPHPCDSLSDGAVRELARVPEEKRQEVLDAVTESGSRPTAAAIRKASKDTEPDYGKCPVCGGTKWEDDAGDGMVCSKCCQPHGEPAGEVDDDWLKTQRQKTVKTVEALMRAFDDLQAMKAKAEHGEAITACKGLLKMAKEWK